MADKTLKKKATPVRKIGTANNAYPRTVEGKRLQQFEMLLNLSKKLAAIECLDEVLETLVDMTTTELKGERGTLFLNDSRTGELYSIVAQGNLKRRIRIMNNTGVAGHVFQTGKGIIVHNAYKDNRFNPEVDQKTGFKTKSILCTPIKTVKGEIIGVAQVLNKKNGKFTGNDLKLLEAMTTQAAAALKGAQFVERMQESRAQELEFLNIVADVTSEIEMGALLAKVMGEATKMLQAERSTIFLNDEKTKELWSLIGQGIGAVQIRFPNHMGIAGAVFTTGSSVNIPYAYADMRFNPAFDKKTGFFTRSILCTPIVNKQGKVLGVTQVLNKRGGPFTEEDESRLKAFTAQISIALENAKLFNDVQNMKNYNEGMLQSMSNGVITLDEEGKIVTCNEAGLRIMKISPENIIGADAAIFFSGPNSWIAEKVRRVEENRQSEVTMDAALEFEGLKVSANITVLPLMSNEGKKLGIMIILEDITGEKRMKSTMSRYMDPVLADKLLEGGQDILGGQNAVATILFSDIRSFTSMTEELGAQGTVSLLNEYFTMMVDCIMSEGGILDKFIGDAIMAAFGIPMSYDDSEDRAVRCSIAMLNVLREWNARRTGEGKRPVDIGIGLNTDTIVSGNIGSAKRMDYTIIGDGVNLASRLESACKQYSARILISENTYGKLRGTYRVRDIDDVVVKGKTKPIRVYEVLDYHTEESFPNLMEMLGFFKEGRQTYRACRWDKAIKLFEEALRLNPQDKLSGLYIERCQYLKANPPGDNWQGVWVMTSK